jgi:hypothetical protein
MTDKLEIKIRGFNVDSDTGFVFNSCLKSFRGALVNKKVSNAVYYKNEQKILASYIQSVGAQIIVACDPNDENTIFGYMIFNLQKNSIWFSYVKETFRRLGVFKEMLIASKLDVTSPIIYHHDTFGGASVISALKSIKFEYVPFYYLALFNGDAA